MVWRSRQLALGAVVAGTVALAGCGGSVSTSSPPAAPRARARRPTTAVKVSDGISRDPSGRPFLFGGEQSDDVRDLQHWLNLAGYDLAEDGIYGPDMVAVVKRSNRHRG